MAKTSSKNSIDFKGKLTQSLLAGIISGVFAIPGLVLGGLWKGTKAGFKSSKNKKKKNDDKDGGGRQTIDININVNRND